MTGKLIVGILGMFFLWLGTLMGLCGSVTLLLLTFCLIIPFTALTISTSLVTALILMVVVGIFMAILSVFVMEKLQ